MGCCFPKGNNEAKVPLLQPSVRKKSEHYRYPDWIEMIFYMFAGCSQFNKKNLYMNRVELKRFLDTVHITDDIEVIFKAMDSDIVDGKISANEFVDYFCNEQVNPNCKNLQKHIENQPTWELLQKALKIFDIVDVDRTGKLEFAEWSTYGNILGLNSEEIEHVWHELDRDNSGDINILEMFDWLKSRLYEQRNEEHPRMSVVKQELN